MGGCGDMQDLRARERVNLVSCYDINSRLCINLRPVIIFPTVTKIFMQHSKKITTINCKK